MAEKNTAPAKPTSSPTDQVKDMGKNAFESVEKGVKDLETKIVHLPIDRRMIVFVGVVILLAAFLGSFGTVLLALIAVGMIYVGFSGNNFLTHFVQDAPEKDKKAKK